MQKLFDEKLETERIICSWLQSNYEWTADRYRKVESRQLFSRLYKHLNDLGRRPITRSQIGSLIKKVFVNVGNLRKGYYANLKVKQSIDDHQCDTNETNKSVVSVLILIIG